MAEFPAGHDAEAQHGWSTEYRIRPSPEAAVPQRKATRAAC